MKKAIQPTCNPLPFREKKVLLTQPVKTLQIFISNLDQHIADSYAKLRKNKLKNCNLETASKDQLRTVQNSNQKDKYKTFENSQAQFSSTLKKDLYDSTCYVLESRFEEDKQRPTLISNEQVSKYINFVYQTYNIPDPLAQVKKQKKLTITKSNQRKNSITTISLRKKSSLSSLKEKIVMQKNIDLTPFKTIQPQSKQSNRHNSSNISAYQQYESHKLNSTYLSAQYSSRKHQSNKKSNQKRLTQTDLDNQAQVEQVFRYCFACEGHVLQKNLRFHQNFCKPLQQAYQKTCSELLAMLNQKINRLTTQVQKGIVQAQAQTFMSQFQNLKTAVADWMKEVTSVSNKQNEIYEQNARLNYKYDTIRQQMNQSLNSHLQSISRLRWFIRLRQNLMLKMKSEE